MSGYVGSGEYTMEISGGWNAASPCYVVYAAARNIFWIQVVSWESYVNSELARLC